MPAKVVYSELKQEAELMLTNRRDAFRGQSRSSKTRCHSICQAWFPISVLQ